MMNDISPRRPGRPKAVLTPEASQQLKEHRRRQLAEAQARRRQKLLGALEQVQQVATMSLELECLHERIHELEATLANKIIDPALAADIAYQKRTAEDIQRRNTLLKEDLANAWRENEQLVKDLRDAKKSLKGKITLAAPEAPKRASILLEKLVTVNYWSGKRDTRSDEVLRGIASLTQIMRQVKLAQTTLEKVSIELKDIMTDGESDILMYGGQALLQIYKVAELAKEQGQRLATTRKAHEDAIFKAATTVVTSAVPALLESIQDQVLFAAWMDPWEFRDLESGAAFVRGTKNSGGKMAPQDILASKLQNVVQEAITSLITRVKEALKDPKHAQEVLISELRNFSEIKDDLLAKHGNLAQKIQVELVARRLEQSV